MAESRIRAIITLLQDEVEANRTLRQVLQDADLLRQVYAFAEQEESIPAILRDALLERHSASLVESFATIDDLEDGLWALPRLEHVLMDFATPGRRRLDDLAAAIGTVTNGAALARLLVDRYCFCCDPRGHHRSANSFLPAVLAGRCGLPILITALWKLLAGRLGIEAEIIVFPGRIYGRWSEGYLDFVDGRWSLDVEALRRTADLLGYHDCGRFLHDADHRRILQRLCLNLAVTYRHQRDMLRCNLAVIVGQMLG